MMLGLDARFEEPSYQNERLVFDMNEAPAIACQASDGFTSFGCSNPAVRWS
jgi:hypothetical protein